jgi:threonine dehydrogenase-like Zn-dependent dehydrogenase
MNDGLIEIFLLEEDMAKKNNKTVNGYMRAALLYGPHDFRIEKIPSPVPAEDEYLIKVKACGVCHSEIHQWEKKISNLKYPRFIGHEVSGEIVGRGENCKKFNIGDKVAAWTDGKGYAELITLKEDRIFPVSDDIPIHYALAEPIACTTNGVLKADIQLQDTVALVGTGFMGLILLQQIKHTGAAKIIAMDTRDEMLSLARKLGADVTINPSKKNYKKIIKDITDDKGVDVSFEIGGNEATINLAAEITRMEGKLVIFGFHPGPRKIKDFGYWNWMAFDIINAHFRNLDTILKGSRIGMDMLNYKRIDMKPLITHEFPIEKIEDAFSVAKDKPKGFVKSVIVFD